MQSSTPPSETARSKSSSKELYDIVTHLQHSEERERTMLSRTLHDELGGLLVSAVMDVGWADQHLGLADEVHHRLGRVRQSLAAAIDLKRNLIEELRPSLLDNFGLFAAFRWYLKQRSERAGIPYTERYPMDEPGLHAEAVTGLFRIMQETLALIYAEPHVKALHINLATEGGVLLMEISHEHAASQATDLFQRSPMEVGLITHRVGLLGGRLTVLGETTATTLSTRFPLDKILAPI